MKPTAALLLFVTLLVGPLAVTTTGSRSAQQPPSGLRASLSPMQVNPGGQVTVTSIQPCPQPMQVFWSLGPGSLSGSASTNTDGSWTVRFPAPSTPGVVPFFAHCAFGAGADAVAMYQQINFTVVSSARPRFTG